MRVWLAAIMAAVLAACVYSSPATQYSDLRDAAVLVDTERGQGGGTVVGPNLVLTARHLQAFGPYTVTFHDGTVRQATEAWVSADDDAMLLRFDGEPFGPVMPVDCSPMTAGEPFWWIGQPEGMRWNLGNGYVSSVDTPDMDWELKDREVVVRASFAPGDSGAGIMSEAHKLRAIVAAIKLSALYETPYGPELSFTQIGFVTPASSFCPALRQLAEAVRWA